MQSNIRTFRNRSKMKGIRSWNKQTSELPQMTFYRIYNHKASILTLFSSRLSDIIYQYVHLPIFSVTHQFMRIRFSYKALNWDKNFGCTGR